jgi:Zn-dependent M28 family amino/carboxypeptidase
MKTVRKISLFFLVAVIVAVSTASNVALAPIIEAQVSESPPRIENAPLVDGSRLMLDLRNLAGERYSESDRSSTRTYIVEQLEAAGFVPVAQEFEGGVNIFAERSLTDPEAGSILLAAHYDTVPGAPGADDNASGVAAVLEAARLLGGRSTTRTLQVAFFDLEELGAIGSLAFVARDNNLENLQGAIILDMVGYACHVAGCQEYPQGLGMEKMLKAAGIPSPDKGEFLAVVGDVEHLPLLTTFKEISQENLPPIFTLPVPFKGILTPDVLRSDHAPFWFKDVGAVLVTDTANMRSPHYHQPSDTIENIDRDFFLGAAQIVVNAATTLLESGESLDSQLTIDN